MSKTRSRIYSRRKNTEFRDTRSRRESDSKDRMQYMMRVSGLFKELKKQNEHFIK
jgi:hypothetical protein